MSTLPSDPASGLSLVPASDEQAARVFLDVLAEKHLLLAAKTYRLELPLDRLPVVPCLDHEALLQGSSPPHLSVYLQDPEGDLHEVGFAPSLGLVRLDAVATLAETSPAARERMLAWLVGAFPQMKVVEKKPSRLRGDRRVAQVVRAQVRLREVLFGTDAVAFEWKLERLRAIADLMEKESRVSSWGIRTLSAPVLGGAGVALWWVLGLLPQVFDNEVEVLRSLLLTLLGSAFLYVGLKAVALTGMGTRAWKRATEYRLIFKARERLLKEQPSRDSLKTASGG